MDIDIEELEEFKVEAFEMLDESEDNLLNLEQGTDFKPNYDSLFRVFHSIKGASGMLGLLDLQKHMHHLEHLLSQVKEQSILSKELSSYLLEGVDGARSLLNLSQIEFPLLTLQEIESGTTESKNTEQSQSEDEAIVSSSEPEVSPTETPSTEPTPPTEDPSSQNESDNDSSIYSNLNEENLSINTAKTQTAETFNADSLTLALFQYCDQQENPKKEELQEILQEQLSQLIQKTL